MGYFRQGDRADAVLFSIVFVAFALLFGYFGFRGALLYLQGSRAAPADPLAWGIGIAAFCGLMYLAVRLLRRDPASDPLLPTPLLLIGGVVVLGGTAWFIILNLQLGEWPPDLRAVGMGLVVGAGALVQWWRQFNKRHEHR